VADFITFSQFAKAASVEFRAAMEKYASDHSQPLDEQLRLGTVAGPLVCKSVSRYGDHAEFEPHSELAFDWGKVEGRQEVCPIKPSEIVTDGKGRTRGKFADPEDPKKMRKGWGGSLNALRARNPYLFAQAAADFESMIRSTLGSAPGEATWPSIAKPLDKNAAMQARDAARAACMNDEIPLLSVKGPPGTGKSNLLVEVAIALAKEGKMVGIVAVSHAVVDALLGELAKCNTGLWLYKVSKQNPGISGVDHGDFGKWSDPEDFDELSDPLAHDNRPDIWAATVIQASRIEVNVEVDAGINRDPGESSEIEEEEGEIEAWENEEGNGEDWLNLEDHVPWENEEAIENEEPMARNRTHPCDVLLLDEAGQIPAYSAAALSFLAPRMILFGDEDQLPAIFQGNHPPGSHGDSSAMAYLRAVLPEAALALEVSHRMNAAICALIQRHFYPDIALQAGRHQHSSLLDESGEVFPALIRDNLVHHHPCLSRSTQEAQRVVEWLKKLLSLSFRQADPQAETGWSTRAIDTGDIAILTPFRTQVAAIQSAISKAGIAKADKLRIGSVDKMQGQGAAVVIFSLASSSQDYIASQAEWLHSANRWDVAISRAIGCAIVIGDFQAHFDALPNALHGMWAQARIQKLLRDDAWSEASAVLGSPVEED